MQFVYELTITCNVTKITNTLAGPYCSLMKIEEEKAIYELYPVPHTTLSITTRDSTTNPLTGFEKHFATDTNHNAFSTKFKTGFESVNHKLHVENMLDVCAADIYTKNKHICNNIDSAVWIGSLWHTGFVNFLFDKNYCYYFKLVNKWIETIGKTYDPTVLSTLNGYLSNDSIYKGGFFTKDVVRLCEYCQHVFGVNKYEVSQHFVKCDISKFDIITPNQYVQDHNMTMIAAIYAELGEIEKAREYYEKSGRVSKLKSFEDYVEKNGTSILSSYF